MTVQCFLRLTHPTTTPHPVTTSHELHVPHVTDTCPLVTHLGEACDPGLAYNSISRTCEWPDTLLEAGCNPESKSCDEMSS